MSKKIYINPGHSDKDPGAVGYETERTLNVKVSGFMAAFLQANYDCEVKMNPGTMSSLSAIANDANKWDADLFVSNHFNAGGGDGYEALVYSKKTVPLGEIFAKYAKAAGQNLRLYGVAPGVKLRPGLTVLKYTQMPAVLNEGAFVDNRKDIEDWNEEHELKKLGEAYAKAAAEYLKLPNKTVQAPEATSAPSANESGNYTLEQFVRDVQAATGSVVDGIAGQETISNTVTVSAYKNQTHKVVAAVQKRLAALGYDVVGEPDGVAGPKFEAAVLAFQEDNRCWVDGELTEKNKTWQKLLEMI